MEIKDPVKSTESVLINLIDKASEEITNYRQRQITTFREAVIVQALVTWGVSQFNLQSNLSGWLIRILAGLACLFVGGLGIWIILSYKKRIYHIRDKRALFVERVQEISLGKVEIRDTFYPTQVKTVPTSTIYSFTLGILSFLTSCINILAGFAVIHDILKK